MEVKFSILPFNIFPILPGFLQEEHKIILRGKDQNVLDETPVLAPMFRLNFDRDFPGVIIGRNIETLGSKYSVEVNILS